ncbi:MAG: protein jag [Oscillospiraceae bacterium]|nr:protein jag [Oscillospiraceae bacterium]
MEQIFSAKSVEEAVELAAKEFGISKEEVKYEVIEEAKKGLFGKIKSEAKIKAEYDEPRYLAAKKYIEEILNKMGISATLSVTENEDGAVINIEGTETGAIIGRRGDTLDALQYLASTICNKNTKDYYRITVDSCGYREKRAETLSELAKKIAASVKKNGRTAALEPMNPYERRIIHSVITEIEGVSSKSVGEEPYRKVVISSDNPRPYRNDKGDRKGGFNKRNGGRRNGQPARDLDLKTSFEKDYKKPTPKPKPEDEMDSTTLYGKIIID